MPLRVIALLLAFVLLWSGVSAIELPGTFVSTLSEQHHAGAPADGQGPAHEGSVDHHHLDDLPGQAQTDPPPEPPGLLPAVLSSPVHGGPPAQPRTLASVVFAPPFLAGPLRPPCGTALMG